ncbi:predicted DNA-binding WGR domain protein [Cereibacter ovatus]|uniref:Predicted DNA-binding WGR domain protein n=1 Tax=Cereibacter ovatus TaxID=439529 RepID=A0A285CRZ8_9RHOB|nr:WGR domain-containing protein [Cereibacter ovatus]SNX70264.1 predicted DNA-binding WGR domain protein [Cereibacter ovatus]
MDIRLEKIDPDSNCYRFYVIRTEPDLFADRSLVVQWGRIGRGGRTVIRGSGPRDRVEDLGQRLLKLRLRHGYHETQAAGVIRPDDAAP